MGRFLNADEVECLGVNGDTSSYNLFAYCGNNPVNREDVVGAFWETAFDVVTLCASITDVVMNPKDPWAWAGAAGDLVDLVPFVVGVGELIKAAKMGKMASKVSANVLPNAEVLKMSQTVQNHMSDIIKRGVNAGQLSRPYIDSSGTTLLLKEIMESADPVLDTVLKTGLRWDVEGTFRGATGIWELVVDTSTNTVVHFNFVVR